MLPSRAPASGRGARAEAFDDPWQIRGERTANTMTALQWK